MDLIATLPEDDSPITKKDKYLVDMITGEMDAPAAGVPNVAAALEPLPDNTHAQFNTVYEKFKYTILIGVTAAVIFSPALDVILCRFMSTGMVLLAKTVLFMCIQYIFFFRTCRSS